MKNILYIHGAFSTKGSFNYIKEKLPKHNITFLEYNIGDDIHDVIDKCVQTLVENNKKVSIVAHSFGGIIAAVVAQKCALVEKVLTISSPFGGSKAADLIKWFNPHPTFTTICTSSSVLRALNGAKPTCPIRSIITTCGQNPIFSEDNDGVVTVSSQKAWNTTDIKELEFNHFEVLMSTEIVAEIRQFLL